MLVSAQGQVGWVSERYLAGAPAEPAISVPAQNQPGYGIVPRQTAASCPSRLYCSQIGSCQEARWYLASAVGARWMAMEMACRARRFVGGA